MIIRTRELPRWNGVMLVGISRGVVGIGHGMQQVSQSKKQISRVKKKTFPRTILFLGKNLFWGAKKEEARERLIFVVHRSLLKHWMIQMFENLNCLSKSANMKIFRSSIVSAPLLSGFGRE